MSASGLAEKVLGLDIGVASVGWCLLETVDGQPCRLLGMGSRIYPPGVEGNLDAFKLGRDEPKNQKRRMARQMRRQLWRRQRRLLKLQRLLIALGLLPALESYDPDAVDRGFKALDKQLMAADPLMSDRRAAQVFHYRLRARSATGAVSAFELGRALYHLAQHRGFLSNRKAKRKDGEEEGEVKAGIDSLKQKIVDSGLPTLGAYFASIDPEFERIRGRWLGRNELIRPEFEAIRAEQAKHHPALHAEQWDEIDKAIFRQRPLRDQSHLIGRCSLEEGERRCPVAYPEAQHFRVLQQVNHLRVIEMEGDREVSERALTNAERLKLIDALMTEGDLSFSAAKKLLGRKSKEIKFSLESGNEDRLIGDRTKRDFARKPEVEPVWSKLTPEARRRLINDMLDYESQDQLSKRLVQRWGFSREVAPAVAALQLEPARLRFSLKAISRLLPHLIEGKAVQTAKCDEYREVAAAESPWDLLPPLAPDRIWREHCSGGRRYSGIEVRNPAVERSLSEVRKVVNAVIRRWGKPDEVRIELARDLKKPRKERKAELVRMTEQRGWRRNALQKMIQQGFPDRAAREARNDVEKVLLWEECGGVCPYTGAMISFEQLLGTQRYQVEHIIPYSMSLEDGFANKTLCDEHENRNRKQNMSPYAAYHGTPEWDNILARVRRFKGPAAMKKLRLFQSTTNGSDVFGDFTQRQLNDTRYASRLASDYIGLLFGGREDADGRRRIAVSAGGATAVMRRRLGLEGLLGGAGKNRSDHRHHAVDALAIALTGPKQVMQIAHASELAVLHGRPAHKLELSLPWGGFLDDVRNAVDAIAVSHRVNRSLKGKLHEDTVYSRPIKDRSGNPTRYFHKRKPLIGGKPITANEVQKIVDPVIRAAVLAKLSERGTDDPKVAFRTEADLPQLPRPDGRLVVVRRVRIATAEKPIAVGAGSRERRVLTGSNHEMQILERLDGSGRCIGLDWRVVTLLDAVRARASQTESASGAFRIRCRLHVNDTVSVRRGDQRCLCVVRALSEGDLELRLLSDARPAKDEQPEFRAERIRFKSVKALTASDVRMCELGPLGSTT